jgi:hypothetical protein
MQFTTWSQTTSSDTRYRNNDEDYIDFPDLGTYQSRDLTRIRNKFLEYINEEREDIDTYKRYLMISVSGDEIHKISNGIQESLLRKNLPSWVMDDLKEGKKVEALAYVRWEGPTYFKYGSDGQTVLTTRKNTRIPRFDGVNDIVVLNNSLCGILEITNVIETRVDRQGVYDKNINEISEKLNKPVNEIDKYGKIKPIYLIKTKDLTLFPEWFDMRIFMTSFTVEKKETGNGTEYKPVPSKICRQCKNMVTVWI